MPQMANDYENTALLMSADELYARLERDQHDLVCIELVPPNHPRAVPPIPGAQSVWRPDYQLPLNGDARHLLLGSSTRVRASRGFHNAFSWSFFVQQPRQVMRSFLVR